MKKYVFLILAFGLLIPETSAYTKGNFDYITIKGPGITEEINVTSPELTSDFFAFADFSKGAIDLPENPGEGYEITRLYLATKDDKPTPIPFDQLHYYPYAGYVFYDGIVNGSSEYDGKWYIANPSANEPFRAVLKQRASLTWITFTVLLVFLSVFFIAYNKKTNPS